jgi:hypothetical protein
VDFGALDGQPVRTLFTLISPTVKAHLHLLSRLAFALRDADFKSLVAKEAGRDEILASARRISESLRAAAVGAPASGTARKEVLQESAVPEAGAPKTGQKEAVT